MSKKPKIGLALGGGLARGLAHIGVLKQLNEEGIKVDYIAGTSMGSVIAALYASGLKLKMIERLAKRISRRTWIDLTFPRMGLIAGDKIEELMQLLTGSRKIEELDIPLSIVTMDIIKGEIVIFREGSIARAVRASCAIPGIFCPVKMGERLLVDGGVLSNVPVEAVKKMGADIIIAVDVTAYVEEYNIENIFDVITKTIEVMSREITQYQVLKSDVIIIPDMRDIAPSHFHCADEAIERGKKACEAAMAEIKSLL